MIEKHPTWLLQFCATLSKRLSYVDRQYSTGREAFNSLAEEFYNSRSAEEQSFFRQASLLGAVDKNTLTELFKNDAATSLITEFGASQFPLIRRLENGKYELHSFFKDFLHEKLLAIDGLETKQRLHALFADRYEVIGELQEAIHHTLQMQNWPKLIRLLTEGSEQLLAQAPLFVKNVLESLPQEQFLADPRLVILRGSALIQLGDMAGAYRCYREAVAQKASGALAGDAIAGYRRMAESFAQRTEYEQAINHLRSALNLISQESAAADGFQENAQQISRSTVALPVARNGVGTRIRIRSWHSLLGSSSSSKWLGALMGLGLGGYLWFGQPDIGLDSSATKLLGLISLTLIFWVFRVLPDYGVALVFAMAIILTKLESAETVMGGFASTTWFMTLGVLGLGAAITGSGLFYRLSLHLVRLFPLSYYWQIFATGIMGVIVMALIPQQTARTVITSQMLVNLSESLGYKTPSKASTGLFVASFLGLGQLGFLFLTGSTTSLIAWGLLPSDVRAQFTWGYWFVAALPPTLVVIIIILLCTIFLYRPESQPKISYTMVQTQLNILGPLSYKEWISLGVLLFHGHRLADGSLPRHRRCLDRDHRLCDPGEYGHHRLEHAAQGYRLGVANSHGCDAGHSDAFETGKNRSMARRHHVAFNFALHGQPGLVFLDHRSAHLCLEADLHQLLGRRHFVSRLAAVVHRRRHEPVDHRDDYLDRIGGLVFSLSGRLAHARLFDY